ncbi:MAG: MarR family winged helix-turn-helix transcriptional regulator [Clostridium sp.]
MDYKNLDIKEAGEIVQSFMMISKNLTSYTKLNAERLGLTIQQMGVLNTVYVGKAITLKDITEKLSMPKSTGSMTVDELVNLGLLEREIGKEDRRKINLVITDKGKELSKRSIENPASYIAMKNALEHISKEDKEMLIRIHKELLESLRKE